MTTTTETFYEILVDGHPLRVAVESNDGRDFCGAETYTLVRHTDWRYEDADPLTLPDDDGIVRRWLNRGSTAWYNASDALHPNWGGIDRSEMSVVKTRVVRVSEPVEFTTPDFVKIETVLRDYTVFDLSSIHRRKGGLPETGNHQGIIVYRGKNDAFDATPDEVREKLTGRDIVIGHKHVRMVSVVQPSDDFFYVFVEIIDYV